MRSSSIPATTARRRSEAPPRRRLGEILLAAQRITPEDLGRALASQHELPFLTERDAQPDPTALAEVPEELARKLRVLPLRLAPDGALLAAVDDPTGLERLEPMAIVLDVELRPVIVASDVLDALLTRGWRRAPPPPVPVEAPRSVPGRAQSAPMTRVVTGPSPAVQGEFEERQSSIVVPPPITLLQPLDPMPAPRAAADLIEVHAPSSSVLPAIPAALGAVFQVRAGDVSGANDRLTRLAAPSGTAEAASAIVAAALDVDADAVELRGEEGLSLRWLAEGAWEAGPDLSPAWVKALAPLLPGPGGRISQSLVLPAGSAFLRCDGTGTRAEPTRQWSLHPGGEPLPPDRLGLSADDLRRARQWVQGREGVVLVVGPARSGRTATLRSFARHLLFGRPAAWVAPTPIAVPPGVAAFDAFPVEAGGAGVAIRRALSSRPRVIFVDDVPADSLAPAILAGAEGLLVVLSIRAADASAALSALRQAGVPDLALGDPLLGVLEQHAVRVLCPACRRRAPPSRLHAAALGMSPESLPPQLAAPGGGCPSCRGRTYTGRRVLFARVELPGGLPAVGRGDLALAVDRARSRRPAEVGATLAAQGITDLGEVARALRDEPPPVRGPQVSVGAGSSSGPQQSTIDGPAPIELDDEPIEADDGESVVQVHAPSIGLSAGPMPPPSQPRLAVRPELLGTNSTASIPTLRTLQPSAPPPPPWAAATAPVSSVRDELDDVLGTPRILAVDGSGELGRRLTQAFPGGRATILAAHRFDEAVDSLGTDLPDLLALRVVGDGSGAAARVHRARQQIGPRRCKIVLFATDHRQERELVTVGADAVISLDQASTAIAERLRPFVR